MTYNFLLVATYGAGKTSVSGATQKMFTTHAVTAPTATTLAAEGLEETKPRSRARSTPEAKRPNTFSNTEPAPATVRTTEKATVSASAGNQGVSATLKGLTPGTEYHFRLIAKNNQGLAEGLDHSFKTTSPPTKEPTKESPAKKNPHQRHSYRRQSHGHNLKLAILGNQRPNLLPAHSSGRSSSRPLSTAQSCTDLWLFPRLALKASFRSSCSPKAPLLPSASSCAPRYMRASSRSR